jgi:hypothetical protein
LNRGYFSSNFLTGQDIIKKRVEALNQEQTGHDELAE